MKKFLIIISLFLCTNIYGTYHSQYGQDKFTNERYFKNLEKGTFVEIGAHDGVTYSNTLFFEKELGWDGICVEPIPEIYQQLKQNRSCTCIEGCITDWSGKGKLLRIKSPFVNTEMLTGLLDKYDSRHLERIEIEIKHFGGTYESIDVNCYQLNDLLENAKISHINLLTIDTEGGELEILFSIDFDKYMIDVISVEDNYNNPLFKIFLEEKNFVYVDKLNSDLIFVNKKLIY